MLASDNRQGGGDEWGCTAAVLYTLNQTCRRHGIYPYHYLQDVLTRLPQGDFLDLAISSQFTGRRLKSQHHQPRQIAFSANYHLQANPLTGSPTDTFIALYLENIAGRLPMLGEVTIFLGLGRKESAEWLSFCRLDDYSQVYQKYGVYSFRLISAAFGPDFQSAVSVNGTRLILLDKRTTRKYVLEFDVPEQT